MKKNNEKIKVLMTATLLVTVFLIAASPTLLAGTSDTFTVAVTGEYIECNVIQASWSVNSGTPVEMSESYYTNATDTLTADTSNSSVAIDIKLQITSDASTWSAATSGNGAAADTYRLNASIDTWSNQVQVITASQTTIKSSLAAGNDQTFDLRFDAPTSTTTGTQQTVTLTASAIKA